jgi:SAM-dependent methyltransferase/uncharacterized protein YbaR (Trm112 family)
MQARLLPILRCPQCQQALRLVSPVAEHQGEIEEGLLHCPQAHWYPVVRGIPRILPDALEEHWPSVERHLKGPLTGHLATLIESRGPVPGRSSYDRRTRENFSQEWGYHDLGGRTWGMRVEDRVDWFFLRPIRLPPAELPGKILLDAGCGNGSQSVAYSALGMEVVAIDLSSGLEQGYAFRSLYPGARPAMVHFVQGDLQHPPFAPATFDLIHSAGVLHHTPDTQATFRALCPLLRPGGTFFVWLYKYEPYVTPVVNAIRALTRQVPAAAIARLAGLMAVPFQLFCATVNALGIRSYHRQGRREAALALMDIFGAPYAHYHDFDEVAQWYRTEGFDEVWNCCVGRRGFGACGRLRASGSRETPPDDREPALGLDTGRR